MSEVSAAAVKQLRDTTGAGMMDCKKALEEASRDMDPAIDYLRKKRAKVAELRAKSYRLQMQIRIKYQDLEIANKKFAEQIKKAHKIKI